MGRILVVDDEPRNVRFLEALLAPEGYLIAAAASGAEALASCAREQPDLVLLDVVMPGMDGFEVCRALRSDPATEALPVVMVTAGTDRDKTAALDAGADDFLMKPIETPELLARVRSLLRIKTQRDTIHAQAAELAELNRTLEARVAQQVEQIERLGRLRNFFSPPLADFILSAGDEALLESHREQIAIVFADLRGFTAFSERTEPEEVIAVLREFREAAGETVHQFEATLGFFAGDGLMAFLNDPLPCPEPAFRAVSLGLALRDRVLGLSARWRRRGHELGFGVGIASGFATLGRTGFRGRWDYGPTGPVVNLASRLCDAAASGQVLVSQRVHAELPVRVEAEELRALTLPGLRDPITAYNVTSVPSGHEPREGLTAREAEVLGLLVDGLSNRAIADRLVISEKTAIRHVANIFGKLGVHTRTQAVRLAMERGLVQTADGDS
jgi:adenylate cyclase